jgi:VWFA-related protein
MALQLRRSVVGVLALAAALVVRPAAQTTAPPVQTTPPAPQTQQPTFRSRVDSVSVDVSVVDKQGNPVSDLTQADFEIREQNKPQAIQTFKFVAIDTMNNGSPAPDVLSFQDQSRELSRTDTRLFVIYLDDYHVRRINSLRVRQILARWEATLSPSDLVAVSYPLTPANGLSFTYDHDAIADAIAHFEGRKYDYTPKNPMEAQYQNLPPDLLERMRNGLVESSLESLCTYLGAVRDGRKTILYVSEGMTGALPVGVRTNGMGPTGQVPQQGLIPPSMDLMTDLEPIFKAAVQNNTTIYTFDPRGLAPSEFDMSDNVSAADDHNTLNESTDVLRTMASQTNGRAMVGHNDMSQDLRQMLKDTSAYYLLGYTTQAPHDGKFHEIKVTVKRKDVEIRARKGFWAFTEDEVTKASAPPKPGPPNDVLDALQRLDSIPEFSDRRPMRIWLGAMRGDGDKAKVTVAWEGAPSASADPADVVDHLQVTATSLQGDELFKGVVPRDASLLERGGAVTFDAPAGAVRVRVEGQNAKNLRLDTDDKNLEIPDFTSPGPTLTDPMVFRGRTARDLQQVRATASPTPTTTRVFSRTERLLLRFQAFGPAGTSPAVAMRLLNQSGDQLAALQDPTAKGDGTYEEEFGLGSLAPGEYLVEITCKVGADTLKKLMAIKVTG